MKTIFTKTIYAIVALFFLVGISVPAFAQAPLSTVTADAGVSAIAKDNSGNTYVIENPGSFDAGGTPTTSGRIVRYTNGSGTSKVVYNGSFIANNDFANTDNYAFGIVVDASKNIYFTTSIGQSYAYGAIIKLTYNSGTDTYSDGGAPYIDYTSQAGNIGYPTGLAMDASNNLYVLLYNLSDGTGGFGAYTVTKYAAGSTTTHSEIYAGLELIGSYNASDTYSSICALAVDPSGNVYVADWFDTRIPANYGGFIEKLTYNSGSGTYTPSQLLNNAYCQALGCDASGNLYANIATAANENSGSLIKFTGGTGTPTTIYTGLNGEQDYWNFGMAVIGADIYTSEGNEGTQSQGYYIHIVASPTSASNVSFSSTTAAGTTISWTNGSGTNRAVFVAAGNSGNPTVANNTSYTASTTFTSGTLAGSGWYCVYNGTGTSVSITGLSPGTTYRAMVVEYNNSGGLLSYNTGTGATNNPNNVTTATPAISAPGGTTTLTSTASGTPGSSTSFNISASNLIANVTATAPSNVQVSSDNSSWGSTTTITQSGGSISSVPVYVRLAGTGSVGTISGNVALSSTSATTVNQAVSGSLNSPSTTISSLTAVSSTTTSAASVQYTATFAASITGLSTSDFGLTTSGVSGASVLSVSGSGTSWTITVSTGSGDGTIQLSMNSASGLSPSVSNLPFNGATYTIDKTAPNVSIGSPSVASIITGTGSVSYTVTYADANFNTSNLSTGNITLNTTGTANGTVGLSGAGTSYTVTISGITGTGTLGISIGAGTASDLAGNTAAASGASSTFNVVYSTDATLSNMVYSKGVLNPVFAPATTNYVNYIPNITTSLTVTPTTNDPNATVTVNGTPVSSGTASAAIPLAVGTNTITTTVTAQDGSTTKSYTVSVIRSPSDNDILSSLKLTPTTAITVVAGPDYKDYTGTVKNSVASIQVTPTSSVATSTITVNGATVVSGTASDPIALSLGQNTITTVVTAQDGSSTKTYVITLTRSLSDNANLSAIRLNPSKALTLVAGPDYKDYTASVTNATSTIQVIPTTADNTATITVNGATVASGASSAPIALAVGSNTITTVVTAQNGVTTHTYGITITRAASSMNNVYEQVSVSNPTDHPQMMGEEINVHQGLSPNGDGINDFLLIDGISSYPDNKLQIMTRSGQLVFEAKGYDNSTKVFDGHSNKNGSMQLPGTYFYTLDYAVNGVAQHKTGFIILKY